jgi:hypothetical protein
MLTTMVMTMWLGVRIYDAAGVSAKDLETARVTVQLAMQHASIEVVWQNCSDTAVPGGSCNAPVDAREVLVRLVAAVGEPMAPATLGYSMVDVQAHAGTLATIFEDRVTTVARRTDFDAGRLLGFAIAHEIGHLLLGTSTHAPRGLMRAIWSDVELRKNSAADWTWSRGEETKIRRGLAARSPQLVAPVRALGSGMFRVER